MTYIELNRTFVNAPEEMPRGDFEAMFDIELLRESGRSWPASSRTVLC